MQKLSNDIIDSFKKDFITSNNIGTTYLILSALQNHDYKLLDHLDDSNKDKKMILLYRDLVYKGYLFENEDDAEGTNVHFSLTDKAKKVINGIKVEETVEEEPLEVIPEPKQIIKENALPVEEELDENDPENWINKWVEIFPVRRADGYPLRNKGVCLNKMKIFLKMKGHEKFTKEIIFEATKLYIQDQTRDGFKYTQLAGNFIWKGESGRGSIKNSTLSTYCELVVDSGNDNNNNQNQELEDNDPFI